MYKRLKTFSMALVMFLTTVLTAFMNVMPAAAAEELTLKLHYHREDGNYDGWDVWMWDSGSDGAGYEFVEEGGEMVATKIIAPGVTSVGFIVRTQDWAKDVDMDQFIELGDVISGTVHVYVESGVEGYTMDLGEDSVSGIKLISAGYDGAETIFVKMTGNIEGDFVSAFKVTGSDGAVSVADVTSSADKEYTITLSDTLDIAGSYTITYDGSDYPITMPDIFSTAEFEDEYTYDGDDLGAVWTPEKTTFRVWAPTAAAVAVNLYESGTAGEDDLIEQLPMTEDANGTWVVEKEGDLNGTYYTYSVTVGGNENEACDPYARTTGVNGNRAMVIDLDSTNPAGWDADTNPNADLSVNDVVLYELHVRDLSSDSSSGITNTGKYLGLTETGTTTASGIPTGLDHIKDLGITHLHLLPVYDYGSVDETRLDTPQFNWGYDPVNYNVPEGSYSTDPYNGEVRVKEMKEMVKALHDNGISVVMDVVYNHVYNAGEFCFNQIVPGYFSRIDADGKYSNGSGCGNDTASERSMVKKYIVDSVCYWADEYHIDGFRFDLVGLIDNETINEVIAEVHKDHPNVIFYGEGWTMSTTLTKEGYTLTTQTHADQTPEFAFFSDTIRDGIRGNVFNNDEVGFVSGARGKESLMEDCFMGMPSWCPSPSQSVNYASCHDNLALIDRIATSARGTTFEEQVRMNNLAAAIVLTSQGIPFMQAGEEMLRSKVNEDGSFNENSYASPDSVNSIKWDTLDDETYWNVYQYYKGLIAFRKEHAALRMSDAEDVKNNITAMDGLDDNVVAFSIEGGANGEVSEGLFVIFNANNAETTVTLPSGTWDVYINGEKAGTEAIETVTGSEVTVSPISAMVLVKTGDAAEVEVTPEATPTTEETVIDTVEPVAPEEVKESSVNVGVIVGIVAAVVVVIGGVAFAIVKKKKK